MQEGHMANCLEIALNITQKSMTKFIKKANQRTYFHCQGGMELFEGVAKALETGEGVEVPVKSTGTLKDGTIISEFSFTWSFRVRASKK